ncbi:MAG: restriction endonuclease subunit S [Paludibacteraceae bacterium]|nr:restriction endonuclease subunit S [Paludibacteraceae bacterium]
MLVTGGVIWAEFYIRDIFPCMVVGKSKGLNHLKKNDSGISYLGATNQNNAVLSFVDPVDSLIQKGNCIAFIRNGEGSMGYSVYKSENFIATSDMTLAYSEYLNKYTGMFITTIADRIRGKYNFGYKRSATRLAKEVLSLPVTSEGVPDWDFMEQYMRKVESRQIFNYLQSIRPDLVSDL